ncbi:unnamed protein product [Rotaria sordida]|uniref:Uncharacterized protein n=1 Tax=Rotaria sordida TaxID=392033 RepID=A0A820AYT2_9BILA|nr:unnamed protein product [Rotaria sordida]
MRQITYLTSELLKATHRFNLRGAIEFIRERIKSRSSSSSSSSHSSPIATSVIDKPMQMLLNDHEFYHELSRAALLNQIVFNDIQRSMMGLYHSLSKYFHSQQTCENIVIDARLLAPSEQFIQRLKMMETSLHRDVNERDHRIVDISKYTIDDLPPLINELEQVQNQYESCQTRLQAAVNVTQSLYEMDLFNIKEFKQAINEWITEHSTRDQNLTNCILATAYMCYSSSFDADLRIIVCQKFVKFCQQYQIPREADLVFQPIPIDRNSRGNTARTNRINRTPITTLAQFLYNQIELKEFQFLRLIPTDIMTENGSIIMVDAVLNG